MERCRQIAAKLGWLALVTNVLMGCSSPAREAEQMLQRYQAAIAEGDLASARNALVALVGIDDDTADYWAELGRVQITLGDIPDAYYSFTRAHELDTGNAEYLSALSQMALRSGNLDLAQDHAEALRLVTPNNPVVNLVLGYVALRAGNTEVAAEEADKLLAIDPYDASAKALKARTILRKGEPDRAVEILREQVRHQPYDINSLRALVGLLDRLDKWSDLTIYGKRLLDLEQTDSAASLVVLQGSLRTSDLNLAREVLRSMIAQDVEANTLETSLDLWTTLGRPEALVEDVVALSSDASDQQKIEFAKFLIEAGRPELAMDLVRHQTDSPVSARNSNGFAVLATALAAQGKLESAMSVFSQILEMDQNHALALTGRVRANMAMKRPAAAIEDAQRLVANNPSSAKARLLLASALSQSGQKRESMRVLWDAFQELPARREIYQALERAVRQDSGSEAADRLRLEFDEQRDLKLIREFV